MINYNKGFTGLVYEHKDIKFMNELKPFITE